MFIQTALPGGSVLTSTGSGSNRSAWEKSSNFHIPAALTTPGALPVTVTILPAAGDAEPHVLTHTILFGPRVDLEQQLRTQAGDLLHRPSQVAVASKQLIDLDSQTLSG